VCGGRNYLGIRLAHLNSTTLLRKNDERAGRRQQGGDHEESARAARRLTQESWGMGEESEGLNEKKLGPRADNTGG